MPATSQPTDPDVTAKVISTIQARPGITIPELALTLNLDTNRLYRLLPELVQDGSLARSEDRGFSVPSGDAPAPAGPPPPAELSPSGSGDPAGTVAISHTNAEGTLVSGTSRGDGSRDALRAARFRWSRNLGAWFLPGSRGRAARRTTIEYLETELRSAGFEVEVDIEQFDAAGAFDALQTHGEERAEMLSGRATQEHTRSQDRYQASRDAVAAIPFGQPILAGHHSEPRHRRDLARSDGHMQKAVEHSRKGDRAAERSTAAIRQTERRATPIVMARRVERLQADARSLRRRLEGAGEAPLRRGELADIEAEITFLEDRIEKSGVRQYTRSDVKPGDLVQIRGTWRAVVKANAKTVAVETAYSWTDKYPYYEVTGHQRPKDTQAASQG